MESQRKLPTTTRPWILQTFAPSQPVEAASSVQPAIVPSFDMASSHASLSNPVASNSLVTPLFIWQRPYRSIHSVRSLPLQLRRRLCPRCRSRNRTTRNQKITIRLLGCSHRQSKQCFFLKFGPVLGRRAFSHPLIPSRTSTVSSSLRGAWARSPSYNQKHLLLPERRLDRSVRLLSRQKDLRRIVHPQRFQVHQVEMFIRQRQVDLANISKLFSTASPMA